MVQGANGNSAAPAIMVNGLDKRFGDVHAVRGVDFEVRAGEVFGFLGPNGAGKTTTINMLCTLVKPTGGSATVADHDIVRERDETLEERMRLFVSAEQLVAVDEPERTRQEDAFSGRQAVDVVLVRAVTEHEPVL